MEYGYEAHGGVRARPPTLVDRDGSHELAVIHKYGHTHLDDLIARAERFENEVIIVSHFSTRMHPDQIQRIIERALPAQLRGRVKIWL